LLGPDAERIDHSCLSIGKEDCKRVVLEGCNGSWAQEHYLPFLMKLAAREEIELWAIDVEEELKLDQAETREAWVIAKKRKAHYVNKSKEVELYNELSAADFVFVVSPAEFHSEIAEFWLSRASPKSRIFIEKPLDESVSAALRLKSKSEEKRNVILAFDHYLAKAGSFLRDVGQYLQEVGPLERMEVHILEPNGIPDNRADALTKGVILDLLCHVLALVGAISDRSPAPSEATLRKVKLEAVMAARYLNSAIPGETFAWIEFLIEDLIVHCAIGKGVGTKDDKHMVIQGSKGLFELDLSTRRFSVFDNRRSKKGSGKLSQNRVEDFLEETLKGNTGHAPGVFDLDAALEILKILDAARHRVDKQSEYTIGSSLGEVLRKLGATP